MTCDELAQKVCRSGKAISSGIGTTLSQVSNVYYPRTLDYTLYSGVHVCWSEHSDSSFIYGFMSLDYNFCTMTTIAL